MTHFSRVHGIAQHTLLPASPSDDELAPLLPRATDDPMSASNPSGVEALAAHRLNVAHRAVERWVPAMLQPHRVTSRAEASSYLPTFRVTPDDVHRGNAMVLCTQLLVGSFGMAAALDGLVASGPTVFNPTGQPNASLAGAGVATALLGATVLGASIGNLWYHALLTLTAHQWRDIQRHDQAAQRAGDGAQIASICALVTGAAFVWIDSLRRQQATPPTGPAAYNAVYEAWLAFNLLVGGPHVLASSNWYLGRVAGAYAAERLRPTFSLRDEEQATLSADDASVEDDSSSRYESDLNDSSIAINESQLTVRARSPR